MMKSKLKNNNLTIFLSERIDSNNAAEIEQEMMDLAASAPDASVTLDASDLDYISSAGLRVLLKLKKQLGKALPIINVSPEIYEIFDVTGFTEILDVQKALREINIEGLEVVGRGATAKVYRLDRETVVKVFNPNADMSIIKKENDMSTNAFLSGIPTAISFDTVKVGDCYGTVYELLDAQDFLSVLENDKAHLDNHIRKFARAIRKMHEIEVDPQKFLPIKQNSIAVFSKLSAILTEEEIGKLIRLYENIPDRNTFIHGDSHPGNVMIQNGELLFIDLMTCGSGHPVFDVGAMCSAYHMPLKFGSRESNPLLRNFTEEETARIWNVYLRSYLDTDDEKLIAKAERQVSAICAARTLFATLFLPGLLQAEATAYLKAVALSYVDEGIEPLCF